MGYWIMLFFTFFICTALIVSAALTFKKEKNQSIKNLHFIAILLTSVIFLYFAVDIPDAVRGGKEVYTDHFPGTSFYSTRGVQYISAGGKILYSYTKYDPKDYDPDAEYKVTYTSFTRTVLKIEKLKMDKK